VTDTDPFNIVEAHFTNAKFYFRSVMMEKLRSLPNHQGEGRDDFRGLERHKSYINKRMTYPMKNKGKEKVLKDSIDNKLLCKAMVL
jgi:hypothetical protein